MKDTDQGIGQGKVCTKCGEWKLLSEYHAAKLGKFGRAATCKVCKKAWQAQYYVENKDQIYASNLAWQENNPDKYAEVRKANQKKYYKNKLKRLKEKYWSDPEAARDKLREKRRLNPEKTKAQNDRSNKKRYEDPKFRVENAVRNGIRDEIKRGSKNGRKTFDLLGYSPDELKEHLEKKFEDGMTWSNYGEWHIDHIVPLSAFNYQTPYDLDFRRAWSLSNLRPLWAVENMKKGAKLEKPFQPSLALAIPFPANINHHTPPARSTQGARIAVSAQMI